MQQRLSSKKNCTILVLIVAFTLCFGLIILCLPGATEVTSQDVFLSGRYGPIWLDISHIIMACTGGNAALTLAGLRWLALLTHVANALLLWSILPKIRLQRRIAGTVLYAWNPVVLLIGITYIHTELITVFFILLTLLFLQRDALLAAWIFIVLAALINPFCLLILPLFLRLIVKRAHYGHTHDPRRLWLSMVITALFLLLVAYGPYWQAWGISGFMASLETTFIPHNALASLDAAMLALPRLLPLSPFMLWLIVPQHWSTCMLVLVGLFLLFSLWFINNLELTLLCSCWVCLLLLLLTPIYCPWYTILPLTLALCTRNKHTFRLTVLLQVAALFSYYCDLWHASWAGQGLVAVLLPFLIWGWLLFFSATWQIAQMAQANEKPSRGRWSRLSEFSRPPWLSRPPRPQRY
ncbi:MAG: hypothetical protein E6J34_07030 [Chloroflexi bacterium]|nr:MAG: hypothetical protein E6J34_07030 [Chloroflexota bacterium]